MKYKITLRQQIEAFYKDHSFPGELSYCFNFYDWFCKDEALKGRAKRLMPKVLKFAEKMDLDLEKYFVYFKNNCPFDGSLYDEFCICNFETGYIVYEVIPSSGYKYTFGKAMVFGKIDSCLIELFLLEKFETMSLIFEGSSWSEMLKKLVPAN